MHLNFLAPIWFEALVLVLLLGRSQIDRVRALPLRRRTPVEIAVLLAAGIGMVGLLRAEQLAVAAVVLVLLVAADTAWVHGRRPEGDAARYGEPA